MLRKRGKKKAFLHIESVYVKKASKNETLPSHRARLVMPLWTVLRNSLKSIPAARHERGGSPAAHEKRVDFARINTPVIHLYTEILRHFGAASSWARKASIAR